MGNNPFKYAEAKFTVYDCCGYTISKQNFFVNLDSIGGKDCDDWAKVDEIDVEIAYRDWAIKRANLENFHCSGCGDLRYDARVTDIVDINGDSLVPHWRE